MPYQFQGTFNKQIWDFDPRTIPQCVLWLDAADASSIRLSGETTNVTNWIDKSTAPTKLGGDTGLTVNGTNPTIATASLNGRDTIAFGGSAILTTASNISTLPNGSASGTYFVVGRETASSGNQMLFQYGIGTSSAASRNRQFYFNADGNAVTDINQAGRAISTSQYTDNSYTMISSVQTTTNTSFLNGAGFTTNNGISMTANIGTTNFYVGGGLSGTPPSSTLGDRLTGNIAEILIFSTALSTAERQQVEGYLAWKWGLQGRLPPSHPYSSPSLPSAYNDLVLWLDASDASTVTPNTNGATVTEWRDKSGNGRNATRSSGSNMTYVTGAQNGLNAIQGPQAPNSDSAVVFITPQIQLSSTNKITCFVVYNQKVFPNNSADFIADSKFITNNGNPDNFQLYSRSRDEDGLNLRYLGRVNGTIGSTASTFSSSTTNVARIYGFTYDGTTGTYFVNGTSPGATITGTNTTGLASSQLHDIFTGYMQGNCCEMIIFGSRLSTTDRQRVEGYLAQKWGLEQALPLTHPYYKSYFPPNLSGLALWLDAADSTTFSFSSGTTVSQWRDKSGNGNNFSVGSGAPTFNSTENAVSFVSTNSATSDTMISSSTITITQNICSIFVVSIIPTNPYGTFQYILNVGNGDNSFRANYNQTIYPNQSFIGIGNTFFYSGTAVVNTGLDTPSYSANTRFIIDGVYALSTTTTNITLSSAANIGGGFRGLTGLIYEVLVINSALSVSQRQQVEGYLATKWGLDGSLPAGHPSYKATIPRNLPGLALWFDAADSNSVVVAPTTSGRWKDKSGNGRDFGRLGPSGPAYGSNAVTFNRTARDCMLSVIPVPWTAGTTNLFVVANLTSSVTGYLIVLGTGGTDFSLRYDGGSAINSNDVFFSTTTANIVQFFNGASNSASTTASIPLVGATSRFLVDGVVQPGSSTTSIQLSNNVDIGGGSRSFGGNMNEVIMCGTLTSAQRLEVQGYLAWKWGLQRLLPATHAYAPFTPTPLSSIDPRNIPGLALWLDASDATTLFSNTAGTTPATVGGTVARWNDKSVNGRNALPNIGSGGTYPSTTINGLAAVGMTTTGNMYSPVPAGTFSTNLSTFVVFMRTGASTAKDTVINRAATSTTDTSGSPFLAYSGTRVIGNGTTFAYLNGVANPFSNTVPTLYNFSISSSANTTWNEWINGTGSTYNLGTGTPGYGDTSTRVWLGGGTSGGEPSMSGVIAEVIMFNTALTTAQRQEVEGYLAYKWGLQANLPSSHPYASPIYTLNEIVPSRFPGLALWLDASDASTLFKDTAGRQLVTTNGDIVRRINDKSGNFRNVTASATTNLYITSQLNRNSGIQVPSPNSGFATPSFTLSSENTCTVFIVALQISSGNASLVQSTNQLTMRIQLEATFARLNLNNTGLNTSLMVTRLGFPNIYSIAFDSTTLTGFFNGIPAGTGSGTSDGSLASSTIYTFATNSGMNGYLYEALLFNTILTTTQRQQIEAYLANKWGLQANLPSTHPYAPTKFTNGPVGFTPTTLSPSLWLDAADATTIDPPVTQWNDKSGNGNNLTTTLGPTRSFTTNNPTGVDLMFASSSSNFLSRTSGLSINSPTFTYFTVIKDLGDTGSYGRFVSAGTTQDQGTTDNTGFSISHDIGNAQGTITKQQGAASPYTQLTVFTGITSPASTYALVSFTSGTTFAGFLNGTPLSAPAITSPLYAFTQFSIGRFFSGGSALTGIVNEAIAFTSALTTTQRQLVEGYLAQKWGLQAQLPANHPYRTSIGPVTRPFLKTFVPTDVSVPCLLWFDGQDARTVTGTTSVTRWNDKSGNANDFTFSGNIPSYQPSTGYVSVGSLGTYGTLTNAVTFTSPTASSIFSVAKSTFPNNVGTYHSVRLSGAGGGLPQFYHSMTGRHSVNGYYIERNQGGNYQFIGTTVYSVNSAISGNGTTVSYTTSTNIPADSLINGTSVAIVSTPGLTPTMNISTISGGGSIVTVTFATDHPFSVGQHISISGVSVNEYNTVNASGTGLNSATPVVVVSVPNSLTITYANTTTAAATGGTVVGTYDGVYSSTTYNSTTGLLTYHNKITATSPTSLAVTGASATGTVVTVNFTNPVAGTPTLFAPGQIMFIQGITTNIGNLNTSNGDSKVVSATPTSVSYTSSATASATYTGGGTIRSLMALPQIFNNYTFIASTIRLNATNITISTAGNALTTTMASTTGNTGSHPFVIASSLPSDIGEIIVYDGALSTKERQDVEGYLMWKWGSQRVVRSGNNLSFPTTHPFYRFPSATTTTPFYAAWDPRTIGNMSLWYDASDSSTLTGSGTSSFAWADKSGVTTASRVNAGGIGGGATIGTISAAVVSGSNTVYTVLGGTSNPFFANNTVSVIGITNISSGGSGFNGSGTIQSVAPVSSGSFTVTVNIESSGTATGFNSSSKIIPTTYPTVSPASVNGLNALRIVDNASAVGFTPVQQAQFSVFMVTGGGGSITDLNGFANLNMTVQTSTQVNVSANGSAGNSIAVSAGILTQPVLLELTSPGVSSTATLYVNGISVGTFGTSTSSNVGLPTLSRDVVGGGSGALYCEVIVYNSLLSTTQRQLVEGYLAAKWGLQAGLSAGHPYKSAGPIAPKII